MTAFHCSIDMRPTTAPSLTLTSSASRTMPALFTDVKAAESLDTRAIAEDILFVGDIDLEPRA